MKVQFRSILFALVLPAAAACGGDRDTAVTTQSDPIASEPKPEVVSEPSPAIGEEQPKVVEVKVAVPTSYDEALALGRELLAKGQYGDAKEALLAAIKFDKKKAEPHIEMARMYIATRERSKSIASAKQAIKLAPLSSQAWNTKGRAELNAHNYDNAIEAFSEAVELNEDNVFAWNNLGYTELLLKNYEDAAEHLTEATSRSGATGYMFNNLGTALEHLDRLDDARMAYEAGGKLGSKEAGASRKRLEGVTSIAMNDDKDTPKTTEYDLTDEGDITDEDEAMETKGSSASEDLESDDDKIEVESAKVEEPEVVEPEVVEPDADEHADLGIGGVETGDEPVE
jgi:tetratricopeptide (TPR) repeat protein